MRRTLTVGLVALAQLGFVTAAVAPQLSARLTGEAYLLRVAPLDPIDPFRGAVAQGVAGSLLFLGGTLIPVPMSTSQTTAAAILGAGRQQRFHTVNVRVVRRVLVVWVLTVPACGVLSGTLLLALSPLL